MRYCLILVLLGAVAACGDSTGPDRQFAGSYNLISLGGDTSHVRPMPDGSLLYISGMMRAESGGDYSYFVTMQACYINGCGTPELYQSAGVWVDGGANVTLKASDGSYETWQYVNGNMSGTSYHVTKSATNLIFQKCDENKPNDCVSSYF